MKAAILFSDFGPYHAARIMGLQTALKKRGHELCAFRFTESSTDYGWKPADPEGVKITTLARKKPAGAWTAFQLALGFWREMRRQQVRAVFLPSYSPLPNLLCFLAAKAAGCKTILMTESWHGTEKASRGGKLIKQILVRMFDSALVGGSPQSDYVISYGMPAGKVFTGYDVVDVDHFITRSDHWRQSSELPIQGLPERFFLNLGRFVEKKNLPVLLDAYAFYVTAHLRRPISGPSSDETPFALVLVGEGPVRVDLEAQARKLGLPVRDGQVNREPAGGAEVVFYPFQQADLTPLFFARCAAFILPSSREEWGLVVNEAMACGAPVLVSSGVGAHFDLVKEGVHGHIFSPNDVVQLAGLLAGIAGDSERSRALGEEGRKRIQDWGPARFGEAGAFALDAAAVA